MRSAVGLVALAPSAIAASDAPVRRERGEHGEYRVLAAAGSPPSETVSFLVPNGELFVLGDNRAKAVDSRRFGTVPISDVQAVARQVWFSAQPGEGIRWSRIGQLLN